MVSGCVVTGAAVSALIGCCGASCLGSAGSVDTGTSGARSWICVTRGSLSLVSTFSGAEATSVWVPSAVLLRGSVCVAASVAASALAGAACGDLFSTAEK